MISARNIGKNADQFIAVLFIKFGCLPAHRIKMNVVTASPRGFSFRLRQQLGADSHFPIFFFDPKDIYVHPAPIRTAEKASDDISRLVMLRKGQRRMTARSRLNCVSDSRTNSISSFEGSLFIFSLLISIKARVRPKP